ncbi:MAG: hypothetical protein A2167_04925 [Planctomycetes bacterium RBG_13_46_10]|nr:MAG: hypothetical protein A2167_04925 [Planctomycetes bacterium RBG_13_46_10]
MKSIIKQSNKNSAFTIVELLTVMSIIVILIGLLVPALNMVRRYAWEVKQKAQFHSIDAALELFNTEFSGYPDSIALGPDGRPYCGAMKLCEAMMGQDLMGFHPDSIFRSDGTDGVRELYPNAATVTPEEYRDNLSVRKGPYLPLESANAYTLEDIYSNTGDFDSRHFVLCDVYRTVTNRTTGKKIGMPVLYYKANTANSLHNIDDPTNTNNIYNYLDNQALIALGIPSAPPGNTGHRLYDPVRFYKNTKNDKVATASRPYRADSYILISAGFDGEYGTPDDVCNYDWKYLP